MAAAAVFSARLQLVLSHKCKLVDWNLCISDQDAVDAVAMLLGAPQGRKARSALKSHRDVFRTGEADSSEGWGGVGWGGCNILCKTMIVYSYFEFSVRKP